MAVRAAAAAKESRKKATNVVIKEMKYRPKIDIHDYNTKTKKVVQFLGEGHKVKVTIMFRGREMAHPELGRKILDQLAADVNEIAMVESAPRQDGRNMTMVLHPTKKPKPTKKDERRRRDAARPPPHLLPLAAPARRTARRRHRWADRRRRRDSDGPARPT